MAAKRLFMWVSFNLEPRTADEHLKVHTALEKARQAVEQSLKESGWGGPTVYKGFTQKRVKLKTPS